MYQYCDWMAKNFLRLFAIQTMLCLIALAQDVPTSTDKYEIRFPAIPAAPVPEPNPDTIPKLEKDTWCVIESTWPDAPLVYASPTGYVKVQKEEGPIKILGKFLDSGGKIESRTYSSKWILTVSPLKTGRVEIIVSPKGAESEEAALRQTIDVFAGEGPRPPPVVVPPVDPPEPPVVVPPVEPPVVDPPKPPEPPVDPPEPPEPAAFRVLFLYESTANNSREQLNIMHSTKLRGWLKSAEGTGAEGYRFWDKDVDVANEPQEWQDMLAAAKAAVANPAAPVSLPAVIVFKGKSGKAYPLAASENAQQDFLKRQKDAVASSTKGGK